MPRIELRLFGHLRRYLPAQGLDGNFVQMPGGVTVGDLLDRLAIPPEDPKILLVNGLHADRQSPLQEGDRVSIFPPVAGG